MNDVGKEKMNEFLGFFFKKEKIDIDISQADYVKVADYEMLICDNFKVLHTKDSSYISIHYKGEMIPLAVEQLSIS